MCHTDPHCVAYFWGYSFLQIWGVGVVRNVFTEGRSDAVLFPWKMPTGHLALGILNPLFREPVVCTQASLGFGKRGLLEKGSLQKSPFRDSREYRDSRDFREAPDSGNKEESDHFLEILENLETSEILESPPVKRPLS